jgi:hypothetical protein
MVLSKLYGEHGLPLKHRLFHPHVEGDEDHEEQRDLGYGAVSMWRYRRRCSPHSLSRGARQIREEQDE